jgi:hypothetical protein
MCHTLTVLELSGSVQRAGAGGGAGDVTTGGTDTSAGAEPDAAPPGEAPACEGPDVEEEQLTSKPAAIAIRSMPIRMGYRLQTCDAIQ